MAAQAHVDRDEGFPQVACQQAQGEARDAEGERVDVHFPADPEARCHRHVLDHGEDLHQQAQ
jgi:hypothetical protein